MRWQRNCFNELPRNVLRKYFNIQAIYRQIDQWKFRGETNGTGMLIFELIKIKFRHVNITNSQNFSAVMPQPPPCGSTPPSPTAVHARLSLTLCIVALRVGVGSWKSLGGHFLFTSLDTRLLYDVTFSRKTQRTADRHQRLYAELYRTLYAVRSTITATAELLDILF